MSEPVKDRRIHWTRDNAHPLAGYRDEPRVDMGAMMRAIRRQVPLAMAFAGLGAACAILMILGSVPRYTAVETVLLDEERGELLDQVSPLPNAVRSDTAVQSEIEIIKSRALAYQVVDLLRLDQDADFLSPPLGATDKAARAVSALTRPLAAVLTPAPPDRQNPDPVTETGGTLPADLGFDLAVTERDRAAGILRDRLTVSRSGRSLVIEIGFADFDPTRAAMIARGYGAAYEGFQLVTTNEVAAKAEQWLRERLVVLEQKSIEAAAALQEFRTENDLVQVRGDLLTEQQQSELASELVTASAATAEAEAYLASIESLLQRAESDPEIVAVPFVEGLVEGDSQDLRRTYLKASQNYARIVSRHGADHPQALQLDESIQSMKSALMRELQQATEAARVAYNIALGREQSLRAGLAATTDTSDWNVALRGRLQQLEAISETYAQVYRDYLARLEVAMQQQNFPIASVKVISPAEIPKSPSSPRKKAILLGGLFLGGLLGALLGTLRELAPKPVRTVTELRQEVGLNCAGMLPGRKSQRDEGANRTRARTFARLAQACEAARNPSQGALVGIAPVSPGATASHEVLVGLASQLIANGAGEVLIVHEDGQAGSWPHTLPNGIETVSLHHAVDTMASADSPDPGQGDLSRLAQDLRGRYSFVLVDLPPLGQSDQSDPNPWAYDVTVLRIAWGRVLPEFVADVLRDHPRFSAALATTVLEEADLARARRYVSRGSYEEVRINA